MSDKTPKILCMDDEPAILRLYESALSVRGYDTVLAKNGAEALAAIRGQEIDLVLADVMMPGISGFEVCASIKQNPDTRHIPVIIVTAVADREARVKGLEAGANDFLAKPVDYTEMLVRINNLLKVKEYDDFLLEHNRILVESVAQKTRELQEAYLDTIYRLTIAAEFRDEDTYSHIRRISLFTRHIAALSGCPDEVADTFYYASPMHDVGKIGIPDSILMKPAPLSPEEFEIMKNHTLIGGRILRNAQSAVLQCGEKCAIYHHERWDGSGYPFSLKGKEIPLEGRILNLVDQYDALRSKRPYKPPLNHEQTVKIITVGDGRTMPCHFDPELLEVFKANHERFAEIFEENK